MDALAALTGSEARARVLTALYGTPPPELYQRELARITELPIVAVQRELRRLVAAGFIRTARVAGRRVYSADPHGPVFAELSAMVMKLRGIAAALARALREQEDVRLAWIFGSFAAGTATGSSDVDLIVIGKASPRRLASEIRRVERALDRSVNEHVVSAAEWTRRLRTGDGFIDNIRKTPKIWLVGDVDELRRLDPS